MLLKMAAVVITGHTHTTGRRERGVGKEIPSPAYMVDDGNLPDGACVETTDNARFEWLSWFWRVPFAGGY